MTTPSDRRPCTDCGAPAMNAPIAISNVAIVLAPEKLVESGLLAWASCFYGGVEIDGLAVRRSADDEIVVTFPARPKAGEQRRHYVRPIDCGVRHQFEAAILPAYFEARRRAGRRVV